MLHGGRLRRAPQHCFGRFSRLLDLSRDNQQSQQSTDDGLRSLIHAHALRIQSVGARTGREVIETGAKAVSPQQPFGGGARQIDVTRIACHLISSQARLRGISGLDRLLPETGSLAVAPVPTLITDKVESIFTVSDIKQKLQRLKPNLLEPFISGNQMGKQHRLRHFLVCICNVIPKPAPAPIGALLVPLRKPDGRFYQRSLYLRGPVITSEKAI